MPTTVEAIESALEEALSPGFRGRLLARGQARAMMMRDGVLPPSAPEFSPTLVYDLQSYGYSLLGLGIRLIEAGGDLALARRAFEQAASALEAVAGKGGDALPDRAFHILMAGAAYHLGRFSARAYSLLQTATFDESLSASEKALVLLMVRDLSGLERLATDTVLRDAGSDAALVEALELALSSIGEAAAADSAVLDGLVHVLTDVFLAAMSNFVISLERGEQEFAERATDILRDGLGACAELNMVPQWWAFRIAIHLVDDLWRSTFHVQLPQAPDGSGASDWPVLRRLYIAVLLCRQKAEVELWPSQLAAVGKALAGSGDLVLSLPTSAGKTRIAELCILRCLAEGKRALFVTPLRALSAQTEVGLRRTFVPLGKRVSSLYGSIGASGHDEQTMRTCDVVVATPEKVDFALRNDPSLLDDVGLVVLDEGHMIGLSEREIRYEVQIQRLLRRADAISRRIVCLSAILPDGEQLQDFTGWLCRDRGEGLVRTDWRPTRLRFGEVIWNGSQGRLNIRVGDERPFVAAFVQGFIPPIGRRQAVFPRDTAELCLATAWQLVSEGQSVLLYCPLRKSVEPLAGRVLDLHRRGALPSLLNIDESLLGDAMALGREWLGRDHPVLACLELGVAVHHAALPSSFRVEIERLLASGVLKVTISSPTLAQGLNLTATVVVMHSLDRNGERIPSSEFRNVIGRAGRAFIDVEGLVLYPIFDNHITRLRKWDALIADTSTKEMESGLLRLVYTLVQRLLASRSWQAAEFIEYLGNNADAWVFRPTPHEVVPDAEKGAAEWKQHITSLDTALLSLLGESEIPEERLESTLDTVLASSLWSRRLQRQNETVRVVLRTALLGRARYIWRNSTQVQRRGYFLAGVGIDAGRALDSRASVLNQLLVGANGAILVGDHAAAIDAITQFAEEVFQVEPFSPGRIPVNWRLLLRGWLLGVSMSDLGGSAGEVMQFVEGALKYRLPWAMEAVRVRAIANQDGIGDSGSAMADFPLSHSVAAVETGALNISASLLIRAGLSSRALAAKVVAGSRADFTDFAGLRAWMTTDGVRDGGIVGSMSEDESRSWKAFVSAFDRQETGAWRESQYAARVEWDNPPQPGMRVRLTTERLVLDPNGRKIGVLLHQPNPTRAGLFLAEVNLDRSLKVSYIGPSGDAWVSG